MNKTIKALNMVIEYLKEIVDTCQAEGWSDKYEKFLLQSCKESLEQPAQEPVCAVQDGEARWYYAVPENGTLLYTHPAQPLTRDWIGTALERADKDEAFRKGLIGELAQPLSDDEIMILLNEIKYSAAEVETTFDYEIRIARAIEAYHGIGVKDAN